MSQKFLDLAGLTVYDKKIKAWIKSGTVDITDDEILALFASEDGYTLIALKKVDISNITYEEVDLGLSVKWANKNIGAKTESDYGTYFSWGNTEGYTISGTKFLTVEETCKLFNIAWGEEVVSTKEELELYLAQLTMNTDSLGVVDGYSFDENTYNTTSGAGFTGDVLDPEHDAATVNMGNSWRMPTHEEYLELINAVKTSAEDNINPLICHFVYLDKNKIEQNILGYLTSNGLISPSCDIVDENGNPLFSKFLGIKFTNISSDNYILFPASGYNLYGSMVIGLNIYGTLWSSSDYEIDLTSKHILEFTPGGINPYPGLSPCGGANIRGVHV
jgi:hypothetical protein